MANKKDIILDPGEGKSFPGLNKRTLIIAPAGQGTVSFELRDSGATDAILLLQFNRIIVPKIFAHLLNKVIAMPSNQLIEKAYNAQKFEIVANPDDRAAKRRRKRQEEKKSAKRQGHQSGASFFSSPAPNANTLAAKDPAPEPLVIADDYGDKLIIKRGPTKETFIFEFASKNEERGEEIEFQDIDMPGMFAHSGNMTGLDPKLLKKRSVEAGIVQRNRPVIETRDIRRKKH